ncbi:MAG: DUF2079 domain-containing protein [Fibrobacteria bacterium]
MNPPNSARSLAPYFLWPTLAALMFFPASGLRFGFKALIVALLAAWTWRNLNRPGKLLPGNGRALPFALSILTLSFFTAMGILAYANYSNYDQGDISCYISVFRNSTGWLPGANVTSGRPLLAMHSEFYCIPVGWIFRLAPSALILQLIQAAAAFTAWGLFRSWISGKCENQATAEWLAWGFALMPCLTAPLLKGFHGVTLATPVLVLTATAFYDRKWRRFVIALIFLLLAKEVFTLTAISFGALALMQRRQGKWILVPALLGLAYGLFLRGWFFPMMLKDSGYFYDAYFAGWKHSLHGLFSQSTFSYFIVLLLWAGSLTAFSNMYWLMALPPAGLYCFLGGGYSIPSNHYILEPSFWLYFSSVVAFLEYLETQEIRERSNAIFEKRLYAFLACLFLMNITLAQNLPFYLHHKLERSYQEALVRIPAEATVALGVGLDDRLYYVRRIYWTVYGGKHPDRTCTWREAFSLKGVPGEFALVHRGIGSPNFPAEDQENLRRCWGDLAKDPEYRTVWEDSVLILVQKAKEMLSDRN